MNKQPNLIMLAGLIFGVIVGGFVLWASLSQAAQADPTEMTPPPAKRHFYHPAPGYASITWWPIQISNQWWMVQRGERGVAVVPCLGGTNCLGEMMNLSK